MYKRNKKQLTFLAIRFLVVSVLLIALSVGAESIVGGILRITGLNQIETLNTVISQSANLITGIISFTGILVYGVFSVTEIYNYMKFGREQGSVTKKEKEEYELQMKLRAGANKNIEKAYRENIKVGSKPELYSGMRELTEDLDIKRHISKNKGR